MRLGARLLLGAQALARGRVFREPKRTGPWRGDGSDSFYIERARAKREARAYRRMKLL